MKTAIAIAALLAATPAAALDKWTWKDTAFEVTFAALVVADVSQTKWALRHGWEESNPLLGKRPTNAQLNAIAIGVPVAHAAVSALLPEGVWRRGWQMLTIGVEGHAVIRSYNVGVKFAF